MNFFFLGLTLLSYSLGFSQKREEKNPVYPPLTIKYKICIVDTPASKGFIGKSDVVDLKSFIVAHNEFEIESPFQQNVAKCTNTFTATDEYPVVLPQVAIDNHFHSKDGLKYYSSEIIANASGNWNVYPEEYPIGLGINKIGSNSNIYGVHENDIIYITHFLDNEKIQNRPSSVFSVSPNPVKGPLTISWHENIKDSLRNIEIISLSDNKLMSVSFVSGEMKTETNVLSDKLPGVYIVKLTLKDGKAFTKKVIKQ